MGQVDQQREALRKANAVRCARAQLKRELANGERSPLELLQEPPECCAKVPVADYLRWLPRWGRARAQRALTAAQVSERMTLGGMTPRARQAIATQIAC